MRRARGRRRISRLGLLAAAAMAATGSGLIVGQAPVSAASQAVSIQNFSFNPSSVSLTSGDAVTWRMLDPGTMHTVTSCKSHPDATGCPNGAGTGGDGGFGSSANLSPDQTFQATFTAAGTYFYYCKIHKGMHGEVEVAAQPPPSPSPASTPPARPPAAHPTPPTAPAAGVGAAHPTQTLPTPSPSPISPSPSPSDTAQALASPSSEATPRHGILGATVGFPRAAGGPGLLPFVIGLVVMLAIGIGVVYFLRIRNPASPAP